MAGPVAAASLTKALSAPAPPSARSTEATYAAPRDLEDVFVGPFRETRRGLDYSYHCNYKTERLNGKRTRITGSINRNLSIFDLLRIKIQIVVVRDSGLELSINCGIHDVEL